MEGIIHELGEMTPNPEPDLAAGREALSAALTEAEAAEAPKPANPAKPAAPKAKPKKSKPKAKPAAKKKAAPVKPAAKKPAPKKRGPGRPKGSKNKPHGERKGPTGFGGITPGTAALVHKLQAKLEKSTGGRFSIDATLAVAAKAALKA